MFAHGVDLNIALGGTCEQFSNVPHTIPMILNLFWKTRMELITTLGQRNGSHIFKEEK